MRAIDPTTLVQVSRETFRAVLERHPAAKDIEIAGGSLEEAFLELTGEPDADEQDMGAR